MRSFVVGTAGHVDHGKSALVRALTGTDPDRLKEEKERGITIDLGFAHCDLGDGIVASFVDVPGHERFVRNMLAGAHGIDAVLLAVAADESVMPQTREHLEICRFLGVAQGVIALTKCDGADPSLQEVAAAEIRDLVSGSFLEGAEVLCTSARSGEGLAELRHALRALARAAPGRAATGVLRIPVDRVFSLRGFGTVATGTMVSGALAVGEEVEALPSGRRGRVRGLHVHGEAAGRVDAGSRVAVNLAGFEVADLERGDVLARPGELRATSIVDVAITLLPDARPLAARARVRAHFASAERLVRVHPLERDALAHGGEILAQLRLENPTIAGRGDRLVLRSYSPAATIGGAVVLDPIAAKRRRVAPARAAVLRALPRETAAAAALAHLREAGLHGVDEATLAARVTAPAAALAAALAGTGDAEKVGGAHSSWIARGALVAAADDLRRFVEAFHRAHPLKAGVPREEARRRVFSASPGGAFERVLGGLADAGSIRVSGDLIALPDHSITLTATEALARTALLESALAAGLVGIAAADAPPGCDVHAWQRVTRLLQDEGVLRRVGDGLLVHREPLEALAAEVRRRWPAGARLDVAGFKELTGLSRRFVIPLLEYLDRERITRRSGSDRFVLA